jgi:hypothetical protein
MFEKIIEENIERSWYLLEIQIEAKQGRNLKP